MKQRPRIYYTESQKKLMWDLWRKVLDPLNLKSSHSSSLTWRFPFLRFQKTATKDINAHVAASSGVQAAGYGFIKSPCPVGKLAIAIFLFSAH